MKTNIAYIIQMSMLIRRFVNNLHGDKEELLEEVN